MGAGALDAREASWDAQFLVTGGAAKPKNAWGGWRGPGCLISVAHGKVGYRSISGNDKILSVSMETIIIQINR